MSNENARWAKEDAEAERLSTQREPGSYAEIHDAAGDKTAAVPAPAIEIDDAFRVHMLNEQGVQLAKEIALTFNTTLRFLQMMCPPGREMSIVRTKLEEACFFAKKAMANDPANQK